MIHIKTTYDQNYTTVRRLGEGGFGMVSLVKRKVDGQVRLSSQPQKGDTMNGLGLIRKPNSARIADTASLLHPCFYL
jgi:hypothetical protein